MSNYSELFTGFETAYIDGSIASNLEYKPSFITNNPSQKKKVISSIEEELLRCDSFQISVAFITMGGVTPFLQTLKSLEEKGVSGQVLTTNYLNFSEPEALKKLNELSNITLKMFDVEAAGNGFHTKGYIFRKEEIYRIIIGSSNITSAALTKNAEWNTKIISTENGEIASEVLKEFNENWKSDYAIEFEKFFDRYEERYKIIKHQREIALQDSIISVEKYRLKPNSMQEESILNLRKLIEAGENKALLISATGTGKTFASAFAMRELGFKRVLFVVHRAQLAYQAKKSYKKVFDTSVSMGIVGAGHNEYNADYVFAMVETLYRDKHLNHYKKDEFDCIILDEAHHSPANTYQKIMNYFTPQLFLGMTATPDKNGDNIAEKNVYEQFDRNIAHEIRLQRAMEDDLLCPFHYFGITDIAVKDMDLSSDKKISEKEFNLLTSEVRVNHVIEKAEYFGYSGDRVKGLVFCSRNKECEKLSYLFNKKGYKTVALSGETSDIERAKAFERLAMNRNDATEEMQPLDYIFSVDILNEGLDIVEVNQVIMLRPTQSPIVFIQQLGRGLRKSEGKEHVVVLDFIGNYNSNFMIPVALSGDRSYNKDVIRKYVISGNSIIPGSSTIHFDRIAEERIFESIDNIKPKQFKKLIKEGYNNLKNRLGRIPKLIDFYENGEIDPIVIIREYVTYYQFVESMEKDIEYDFSEKERLTLEYLSNTILSGIRPDELIILQQMLHNEKVQYREIIECCKNNYGYIIGNVEIDAAVDVLAGKFVRNDNEYDKYKQIDILKQDNNRLERLLSYSRRLQHKDFYNQIEDIIIVGLSRYKDKYKNIYKDDRPFVLYEKYTRRDISLLMNAGKDISSTMYGMSRIGDDMFIWVTYHKEENTDEEKQYVDGKPDYADEFIDNVMFRWDSQIDKKRGGDYMNKVETAPRKHLMIKKSDKENNFFYMGEFDIVEVREATKKNNKGIDKPICKLKCKMKTAVREDILRYLQSKEEVEKKVV